MGVLYIVATPIGNLEDISIRALKNLFSVDAIACEDTRKTGMLLKLLNEKYKTTILSLENNRPELISYYEQNELQRIPQIINALKNGMNVALVSDAGTPAISDPGYKLIRECIKEGINIESIPGASSVITSLVVSGLPTDRFLFVGYPPRKPGHRVKFFDDIRISLTTLSATFIPFFKVHESKRRGKISETISHYTKTKPKGEYVILFHI